MEIKDIISNAIAFIALALSIISILRSIRNKRMIESNTLDNIRYEIVRTIIETETIRIYDLTKNYSYLSNLKLKCLELDNTDNEFKNQIKEHQKLAEQQISIIKNGIEQDKKVETEVEDLMQKTNPTNELLSTINSLLQTVKTSQSKALRERAKFEENIYMGEDLMRTIEVIKKKNNKI